MGRRFEVNTLSLGVYVCVFASKLNISRPGCKLLSRLCWHLARCYQWPLLLLPITRNPEYTQTSKTPAALIHTYCSSKLEIHYQAVQSCSIAMGARSFIH